MKMAVKIGKPLLPLLLLAILSCVFAGREFQRSCNVTRQLANKLLISQQEVHNNSRADNNLKVCERNGTCCTRTLERKLQQASEEIRIKMFSETEKNIKHIFSKMETNFTGFFSGLIENAYTDLDKLYARTYQDRYTNHKAIFRDLFTKLGEYMKGTELIDLKAQIDSWFSMLYQKVYVISNDKSIYDASYKHCILETAEAVRPFGDIPRKLGVQIKKSFLASKVLVEAVRSAKNVVHELLNMKTHEKCVEAFMKMSQCRACIGALDVKPCHTYCINVVKGCSAYPAVVGPSWKVFLNTLMKLAIKIDNPFNMEAVIRPLGVEISAGIMLFQLNTQNITATVEKKCGVPPKKKANPMKRRSLSSDDMTYSYNFLENSNSILRPTTAYGTSLDRLIRKLKEVIIEVKEHWTSLPRKICSSGLAATQTETERCWNGREVDSYLHPVVKDGIDGMFKNPEVHLNITDPHLTVTRQVIKLKEITQRITLAIGGSDSNRVDLEEGSGEETSSGDGVISGSGSGDGSGSGVAPTTWPQPLPTTGTEIINNNVFDDTTPAYPTTKTMGNEIPGLDYRDDQVNQVYKSEIEKSRGNNPLNRASNVVGTIIATVISVMLTGLLLL